jgi:hypothetical protein
VLHDLLHSVGNWLYGSGGTLLAATAALIAARAAWRAVQKQITANQNQATRQINANQQNVAAQIDANQKAIQAQIDAEEKRRKRAERLNVVTEAQVIVNEIFFWATDDALRRGTDEAKRVLKSFELKVLTIAAKLVLVDMREESNSVAEYWVRAKERADNSRINLPAKYGEILEALKHAVDS